jgi:hypothetical protein
MRTKDEGRRTQDRLILPRSGWRHSNSDWATIGSHGIRYMDTVSQLNCRLVLVLWLYDVKEWVWDWKFSLISIDTLDFCPFLASHAGI